MKIFTTSAAVLCLAGLVQADTRMKVRYTTNGEVTETTVYTKGARQRLEYPDVVVIQQPDQQRLLQLDPKSKAYTILPANVSAAPAPAPAPAGVPRKGGIVMVTTATSSTGETKEILGHTAKHIKTVTTQQPASVHRSTRTRVTRRTTSAVAAPVAARAALVTTTTKVTQP